MEADEKTAIEAAIADLRSVIEQDDKEAIETKTQALAEASSKMAEQMYAQSGADAEGAEATEANAADDVVDAEFEEVKEKKS